MAISKSVWLDGLGASGVQVEFACRKITHSCEMISVTISDFIVAANQCTCKGNSLYCDCMVIIFALIHNI